MNYSTQDTSELNRFKSISSSWWNEVGPYRLLHEITPLRLAFMREKLGVYFQHNKITDKPFEGLRILDVGCGGGLLCEPLARLGAKVTGIDALEENIAIAQAHAETMGLSIAYHSCAIEDLKPDSASFDVVIASEIIEHVVNPDLFLKTCTKHLKARGCMFITTLNKTFKSYLFGIIAAEYVLKWTPPGTHSWDKFMAPETLSQKLTTLGLGNQDIRGLSFSLWTREWSLSPHTDINYFLWAGRA